MKAIVYDRYRSADGVLELQDVDKPVVNDDEVLVRVRAASADYVFTWYLPAVLRHIGRIAGGLRKRRKRVPGLDFAGQVEAVGKNVRRFQPGDEVLVGAEVLSLSMCLSPRKHWRLSRRM